MLLWSRHKILAWFRLLVLEFTFHLITKVSCHFDKNFHFICSNPISSLTQTFTLYALLKTKQKKNQKKSSMTLRHSPVTQMRFKSGYSNTVIVWLSWLHQSVSSEVLHCHGFVIYPKLTQSLRTDNNIAPNPEANKSKPRTVAMSWNEFMVAAWTNNSIIHRKNKTKPEYRAIKRNVRLCKMVKNAAFSLISCVFSLMGFLRLSAQLYTGKQPH